MAININKVVWSLVLAVGVLFLLVPPPSCNAHLLKKCGIDAIYQLGDSISDTGNLIRENPQSLFARPPYGQTFFKKATGRCSDGLLIIDYFTISAGVPFLDAYLNPNPETRDHGVNFAVTGATALPVNILEEKNISAQGTNSSLSKQLDWMFTYLNGSLCKSTEYCAKKLEKTLFMVGEIGGKDYNYALFQDKSLKVIKTMVPDVVLAIKDAVTTIISYGARQVVVPGNLPVGCFPVYLTSFQTNDSAAYDKFHCLKGLNNLSKYHNRLLKQALQELRKENPDATIIYGDYYNAFMWILQNARSFGFDPSMVQKACCGIGGKYNFNLTKMCGAPGVPACANPFTRISWDGVHLTQSAYGRMAWWLIRDIVPKFHCHS